MKTIFKGGRVFLLMLPGSRMRQNIFRNARTIKQDAFVDDVWWNQFSLKLISPNLNCRCSRCDDFSKDLWKHPPEDFRFHFSCHVYSASICMSKCEKWLPCGIPKIGNSFIFILDLLWSFYLLPQSCDVMPQLGGRWIRIRNRLHNVLFFANMQRDISFH